MGNYMNDHVLESAEITFAQAYRQLVFSLLDQNPDMILGDADLGRALYGADYAELKKERPDQMYDVGIQEANLVGIAAGLSVVGRIPVVHSFAAFITRRVYDTLFVSGAYSKLDLKLIGTDPGITSTYNGGTHMTFEDVGLMRNVPDAVIFEPADLTALRKILPELIEMRGICYIRMPRNIRPIKLYPSDLQMKVGQAVMIRNGMDATIVALGTEVIEAVRAAEMLYKEGIHVRVLDPVTVQPLDCEAVIKAARETKALVVAENHSMKTGLFAAVSEILTRRFPCPAESVGIDGEFGEVGNYNELLHRFHLAAEDIAEKVRICICRKECWQRGEEI